MTSTPPVSTKSVASEPTWKSPALVAVRFFTALALSLWIGGMAFFGIMAAPVLFHPEKSGVPRTFNTSVIAPQMVSAMLTRFGTLTNICLVILVLSWAIDGILSKAVKKRAWRIQGGLTLICLLLSQYLNVVLLPRTKAEQGKILPLIARAEQGGKLTPKEQASRAAFDAGHESYKKLASLNLYLLMAVLVVLLSRPLTIATAQTDRN